MARDEIAINFTANVSEVAKGNRDMQRDLSKTADSIDDFGKAGDNAGKQVSDGLDKAGKATGDLKSQVGDAVQQITQGFDGSAESVASGFAGALESVSSLIPGVGGLIGGALGAVAVGMFDSWSENSEKAAQAVSDMYDDMVASGNSYLSEDFISQRLKEIGDNTDEWNKAQADSKTLGVDLSTVLRAQAGDLTAVNDVISHGNDIARDKQAVADKEIEVNGRASQSTLETRDAARKLVDEYAALATNQDTAAAKAATIAGAMSGASGSAAVAEKNVRGLSDAMRSVPPGVSIPITADTSAYFAALEDIRRKNFSKSVDIVINERRGTQVQ